MVNRAFLDQFPFRLGTTSYIIPADVLPNVRYLAGKVKDVELVLFDVDEYCNIPDAKQIAALKQIAVDADLTYTVHLPLDIKLSADRKTRDASLIKAQQVIEATLPLEPFGWVTHLDSHAIHMEATAAEQARWIENCTAALELLLPSLPDARKLTVENLESYPPEWNHAVLDAVAVSECIDIGHLWLQKRDPLAVIGARLDRTRVMHLHGIGTRDHASLQFVPTAELRRVIRLLMDRHYDGVLSLEIFSEDDLNSSMEAIRQVL